MSLAGSSSVLPSQLSSTPLQISALGAAASQSLSPLSVHMRWPAHLVVAPPTVPATWQVVAILAAFAASLQLHVPNFLPASVSTTAATQKSPSLPSASVVGLQV